MFSGLSWDFPIAETFSYIPEHFDLIMPLVVLIVGVLLALLVVDGITLSMLKVLGFVAGVHTSGIDGRKNSKMGLGDESELD